MAYQSALQLIREQLKQKDLELKKQERESNRLNRRMHRLTFLNKEKIRELHALIEEKDRKVEEARQSALAARVARHAGISKPKEASPLPPDPLIDLPGSTANLQQKIVILQGQEKELKKKLILEQKALDKANRDKSILLKELRRLQKQLQTIDNLNEEIIRLKADLKRRSGPPNLELEQRIRDKDKLIENYERVLQETLNTGSDKMLPSDVIIDLKMEVQELQDERNKLVEILEDQKEYISDLEMKSNLEGEKRSPSHLTSQAGLENRTRASTEFTSGLESFLVTYSDMITLILVIFVLLFTVSKVDENKFSEAFSSFQEKEYRVDNHNLRLNPDEFSMLKRVRELVQDNVDPNSLRRSDVHTILIRIKSGDLFSPGKAELIPGAEESIKVAIQEEILEGVKQIQVEGHTDDVPIHNQFFPSNWELSTARAARVARFITAKLRIPPERLVVKGYGKYRPFKPNDSDFNRDLNRRVDIKILKDIDVYKEEQRRRRSKMPKLNRAGFTP